MHHHLPRFYKLSLAAIITSAPFSAAGGVIYAEDFSNPAVLVSEVPYLGGWYSPQVNFGDVIGGTSASVAGGALSIQNTSQSPHRGAAIVINPSTFTDGAGAYELVFDISSIGSIGGGPLATGDFADVRIWSGSGYSGHGSPTSADALRINTLSGELEAEGNAVVANIGPINSQFTAITTQQIIPFNFDGFSAVTLFFGAGNINNGSHNPHPTVSYDNVQIRTEMSVVPEPSSSLALGMLLCATVASHRVRRRR